MLRNHYRVVKPAHLHAGSDSRSSALTMASLEVVPEKLKTRPCMFALHPKLLVLRSQYSLQVCCFSLLSCVRNFVSQVWAGCTSLRGQAATLTVFHALNMLRESLIDRLKPLPSTLLLREMLAVSEAASSSEIFSLSSPRLLKILPGCVKR